MGTRARPDPSEVHLGELPAPGPRILVGTAGTGTTWGLVTSIRERWGPSIYVLAVDMLPSHLVATSSLADRFEMVSAVSDPAFSDRLLALIREEQINTYVPTHDPEIVLAAQLRDRGALDGVCVLAPPLWAAKTCLDKRAASNWLESRGIPAPRSVAFDSDEWTDAGIVIKPRRGVGSVGVERVDHSAKWTEWCRRQDLADWLAQEAVPGAEVTLDCFRSARGPDNRVLPRERVEVKSGVCTKARLFEDDELAQIGRAVGEGLDLVGGYCLQVMRSTDGRWLVTDINPRPGAGTRLAAAVGVNFHAAMLVDAWGFPTEHLLPRLDKERWVVRQYQEVVLV